MANKIYQISLVIYSFFYLNVLWLIFCLAGLGIFGIIPSSIAGFTLLRRQVQTGEWDVTYKNYYAEFKKNFKPMIIPSLFCSLLAIIFYFDYQFSASFNGSMKGNMEFVFLILGALLILYVLAYFPVHAYFNFEGRKTIMMKPLQLLIMNPILGIVTFILFAVSEMLVYYTNGIFGLCFFSVPAYISMRLYTRYFERLLKKNEII